MSIRCWKCDATFRPKGLFFYRKTHCPECGCAIDFDSIALTRNWNLILMTVIPFAAMLFPLWFGKWSYREMGYASLEMVCAVFAFMYLIDYPITCFLYNHFSCEELRSGRIKPLDSHYPRSTVIIGIALFAAFIVFFLLLTTVTHY